MKLIGLIILAVDIWALWHVWNHTLETGPKVLWSVAIVVFPLVGPIVYFLFGRAGAR